MTECGYKNNSSKFILEEPLKWGMLSLCTLIFIHKNALKNEYNWDYYPDLIVFVICDFITGKSFSEALILALTNPQSVVILWVNWCKNKSFWERFTCIEYWVSGGIYNSHTYASFAQHIISLRFIGFMSPFEWSIINLNLKHHLLDILASYYVFKVFCFRFESRICTCLFRQYLCMTT